MSHIVDIVTVLNIHEATKATAENSCDCHACLGATCGPCVAGPQNERVAKEQYQHRTWEDIESQYVRVLSWRILGGNRMLLFGDRAFDVAVTRQRTVIREHVEASGGPFKLYGYSSSISAVQAESANGRVGGGTVRSTQSSEVCFEDWNH
jgi:hypothetical protein